MEKQILYHGSTVVVEQPLVSIGRKDLDFGPGFILRLFLSRLPNGLCVSRPFDEQNKL